ncbi:MAG: sugar ABC transporter ATP-binding protein [Chloroflexota bacterium]|jgi:ribose transport system ATP-binding protein
MTQPQTVPTSPPLLEVRGLTKEFPGVRALDAVSMSVLPGEVHALVGENGAGKSTLVKVLCGVELPDAGELLLDGRPYLARDPQEALRAGVRVVYQELNLLSYLSIAENLSLEDLPQRHGLLDRGALRRRASALLAEVGLDVSPDTPVEELGIAQMQMVEIARVLRTDARLLILDEPTATLTPREVERLFAIIRTLTAKGIGVLFISHHLDEMKDIGDRVTVLRNGRVAATREVADTSVATIIELMVGRAMHEGYPFRESVRPGGALLAVEGLTYRGNREPISLTLHEGEILGVAGLVGSGRTEAMRAIFGADQATGGRIRIRDREVPIRSPRDAVAAGLCLLTEDRKTQGLMLDMTCAQNTTITRIEAVSSHGLIQHRREGDEAQALIDALSIRAQSPAQVVRFLSGGNQQKVVVAKWLFAESSALIFDEPTRGIDVGARFEIYNLIWDLAARGKGVIVVSSDLPELLGICHRIIVFSRGAVAGELPRDRFSERAVLELAYRNYLEPGTTAAPAAQQGTVG